MSTRQQGEPARTISSYRDLVEWIAEGSKPKENWRIGTEHEKFVFTVDGHKPVPYEGERGIRRLLDELVARFRWEPIHEGDHVIALKRPVGEGLETISLEPGGQFELSGAPLCTLHQTCAETGDHLKQVQAVGKDLGIAFLGLGFAPTWSLEEMPQMPKQRYGIMTAYMPKVGSRGLDMMYRTATIQVNLDFADERDMVQKLRVSLALQPIATALFAASPFTDGRLNGFKSMRSEIWRHTDNNRTGMLPFAFEDGMGFERYVDYALDVPMYFVYRDGRYIDASGASFRDFLASRLPALPGEQPTIDDWSDHLTTLFPEVRMKRFLEMRGADGGPWRRICALPAFWVGLLYHQPALDAAWDLVKDWTAEERQALRDAVPGSALAATHRGRTVQAIAAEVLEISRMGLAGRAALDSDGEDETHFIEALEEFASTGRTAADELISRYEGAWNRSVAPVFESYAF
ncbi:MAG: hypothetical protein RLZ98_814 [Pseudomonadota bacterium]